MIKKMLVLFFLCFVVGCSSKDEVTVYEVTECCEENECFWTVIYEIKYGFLQEQVFYTEKGAYDFAKSKGYIR